MKFFLLLFSIAGLVVVTASAQNDAQTRVQQLYQQGINAMRDGETAVARDSFNAVLELDPRHANARYQLKQLSLDAGKMDVRRREMEFSRIMIPEVDLDGASLSEALEALGALVERESKGRFVPNFILRDPTGQLGNRKISIRLRGVPANVVLRYVADQAGVVVRFDRHAIIIRPPSGGGPVSDQEG